jgi:uncharacterized membrane protein
MNSWLLSFLTIFGMGCAVYATRLAGYWLLQGRSLEGRWKAAFDAVPPAILVAVIAPALFLNGKAEMIAGALTAIAALLRLPLLVVIAVGVASVAVLRQFII